MLYDSWSFFCLAEGLPEVRADETEIRARPGDSIQLRCSGEGEPRPELVWSRLDGPLPSSSVQQDGILNVDGFSEPDQGVYICTARNPKGSRQVEVRVIADGATYPIYPTPYPEPDSTTEDQREPWRPPPGDQVYPTATIDQELQVAYEGDTAVLTCVAAGNPRPVVNWSKTTSRRVAGPRSERHKVTLANYQTL